MKTRNCIFLIVLTACVCSCSVIMVEDKPPRQYTIAQFMDIVQITGGAFSPDESKILLNT